MKGNIRVVSIVVFLVFAVISAISSFNIKFSFDFTQFFPEGDEDLEYFSEFIENFESDDNFMLVAVHHQEGVFDSSFLQRFHDLTLNSKKLPFVTSAQSLTLYKYPLKTPFSFTAVPAIHLKSPSKYESDKKRILNDEMLVGNLISKDAKTMLLVIKNINNIQQPDAVIFMEALNELIETYDFDDYHYLGRPNFMVEMVDMQKREIIVSAVVSAILVLIVMFFIFQRFWGVTISIVSIGLGLLLFIGVMTLWGREFDAMSALYPVLMIIVGTSDVVHIMSKYIDELKKGFTKMEAIKTAFREIGMATLLTSLTTAIGFATLLSSKVPPIRNFGINAAIGVMVAYLTVILFTTAVVSFFKKEQIIKLGTGTSLWNKIMGSSYDFTVKYPRQILIGSAGVLLMCFIGISLITTNYRLEENMPRGEKITEDFLFFEDNFGGFRPFEIVVTAKQDYSINDYEVIREMDKLEQHLKSYRVVQNINSITSAYKGMNKAYKGNQQQAFVFPQTKGRFEQYQKFINRMPPSTMNLLVSKDGKQARITAKLLDIGADSIGAVVEGMNVWIDQNIDTNVVAFRETGTGVIIDKNAEYITNSLIWGLGLAIAIVSLLMGILFKNMKMLFISLIPNIFPLLIAGAIIGFSGIELDAGVTIVFAIIFGIAVDDTIHFLSKYKLSINKGMDMEEALKLTFLETGKAICLTTIILFFGFLVLLFSIHPPSVKIGILISSTLISALVSDLLLIPILIRRFLK